MLQSIVPVVAVLAGVGAVLVALTRVARRARRTGTAGQALGAAMAAYDEAMHVTAFDAYAELQREDQRGAERPSPGDE